MQTEAFMYYLRSTRTLLPILTIAMTMPGIASAQVDPGPPPASAAAVPTIAQAKAFIEDKFSLAAAGSCQAGPGKRETSYRASIKIEGHNATITYGEIDVFKGPVSSHTTERSNLETIDFQEIDRVTITDYPTSCGRKQYIVLACRAGKSCIGHKWSITDIHTWLDPRDGAPEKTDDSKEGIEPTTGVVLFDADLGSRLVKAFQFYSKAMKETEGVSAF